MDGAAQQAVFLGGIVLEMIVAYVERVYDQGNLGGFGI